MGRVVVLGSLNADLVTRVERHPSGGETVLGDGLEHLAGGKGANQAVAAAAAGAEVVMAGAVGDDAAGTAYLERLRGRGIDVSRVVVRDDQPTGTALIVVDEHAENTIVVIPGANGALTPDLAAASLDDLGTGDVLLVQLEIPLDTVAEACRAAVGQGARVVLNVAPYADLPDDIVALADPMVANEHEAAQLSAEPASLCVTLGSEGARWGDLREPAVVVPAGEVADTTGAGDAFCGALAAALADGATDADALTAALAAGGEAVQRVGAQPDPAL